MQKQYVNVTTPKARKRYPLVGSREALVRRAEGFVPICASAHPKLMKYDACRMKPGMIFGNLVSHVSFSRPAMAAVKLICPAWWIF